MKIPKPKNCKVWSTPIPIYGGWLHLVVGDSSSAIIKGRRKFAKLLGDDARSDRDDWDALAVSSQDGEYALFFHRKAHTHGVVAHEMAHITARILQYVGIEYTADNMEAFTYLLQWLTEWVYGNSSPKRRMP